MLSSHLNALQSVMIVLHPAQILFLMLVYHPFNSKTKIFLRLYVPLTIIKPMLAQAQAHDISIRLLKICNSSVVKPLSIIFKKFLQTGTFPNSWKMPNIAPTHKKGDKQLLQNYCPVSLLPICSKVFEFFFSIQC